MYQKTQIIGRLGADPEMRFTQKGTPVTTFRVAVDGLKDETTWFRVTTWGKLAEVCNEYLGKGRLVFIEGEVSVSAWTGKDGKPRAPLELTANAVKFLDGKGKANGNERSTAEPREAEPEPVAEESEEPVQAKSAPAPEPKPKPESVTEPAPEAPKPQPDENFDDFFDDLPF